MAPRECVVCVVCVCTCLSGWHSCCTVCSGPYPSITLVSSCVVPLSGGQKGKMHSAVSCSRGSDVHCHLSVRVIVFFTVLWSKMIEYGSHEASINSFIQQSMMAQNLQASPRKLKMRRKFIFQHHNDQKHESKSTKERLHQKKTSSGLCV